MDNLRSKIKAEYLFVAAVSAVMLVLFVIRLVHGVETSDEAFYNSIGYRLIKGNIPFGDMWEVMATDSLIMAPFYLIRSIFVKGGEGLQLYSRICFMILNGIGAFGIFKFASRRIKGTYAFLTALLFWFNAPFQIYDFSYNNMANTFISLTICLMMMGFDEYKKRYFILMGIAMAFAILAYPTMIYFCVIFPVVMLIRSRSLKGLKSCLLYAAGGIGTAIPVVIFIAAHTGFSGLIKNIQYILSSDTAHSLEAGHILYQIKDAFIFLTDPFSNFGIVFMIWVAAMTITAAIRKTRPAAICMTVMYPLVCGYFCAVQGGVKAVMNFIFCMIFIAPAAVFLSESGAARIKEFMLEFGLGLLVYFVLSFSTGGGPAQAINGLVFAAVASVIMMAESASSFSGPKLSSIMVYSLVIFAVASEILCFYRGIYRDDPYMKLNTRVESGLYKGLYTTADRKEHLEDLGELMASLEEKDESVMILYHCCYSYMMVDMTPKIPSTWGCFDVETYGFDNEEVFLTYLAEEDNIPDNVLIVDIPQRFDTAGQQKELYEPYYGRLIEFIEENYTYTGEFENGRSGKVIKYERKTV